MEGGVVIAADDIGCSAQVKEWARRCDRMHAQAYAMTKVRRNGNKIRPSACTA